MSGSGSGISFAICKSAPHSRQVTTPALHHSVFYRPDALPAAQPTASTHWRHGVNRWTSKQTNILSLITQRYYNLRCQYLRWFGHFQSNSHEALLRQRQKHWDIWCIQLHSPYNRTCTTVLWLWCCWLGGRWGAGTVICLERGADLPRIQQTARRQRRLFHHEWGCEWRKDDVNALDKESAVGSLHCFCTRTDNHANTSSIFTGRMLFLTPNQQCQCTESNSAQQNWIEEGFALQSTQNKSFWKRSWLGTEQLNPTKRS